MKTISSKTMTSNASRLAARRWSAGLLLAGLLGLGMRAHAATFALSPNSQSVPVGSTFTVTLIANLGTTAAANAIQADLTYPSGLLQLVSTDDTASPFTAWRQVTPSSGALSFVQAQPSPGLTGDNLAVAVIRFFAKSAGTASIQFNNATCAILLNSNNTNVYSPSTGGSYTLNAPDTTPPVISAITASPIYLSSATITWTTDELSDSQVSYGLTNALGTSTTLDSNMLTSHSVPLSGLTANTSYFFVVKSRDSAGNLAISSTSTFKTLVAPDTTAPTVSLTAPANGATVSGSAVTVSASASDNVGVVGVQFKLDGVNLGAEDLASPYSLVWNTTSTANGSHTLSAVARDASGNTNTASVTVTVSNDVTPPVISAVAVSSIYITSAAITWTTDELSDSQVSYGLTNALGTSTTLDSNMLTSHSVPLSGLTANTSYFFVVKSRDSAGNLAISSTSTFKTLVAPDTTAPTVSLTAPANGATVSGSAVTVSASASDNVGVVGVQFKLDGVNLGAEDLASPYSLVWNTTSTANGSHTLSVVARDAAGNTNTASISVTVSNDTTPPSISGISVGVSTASATVIWTTNELSDSQVDFGTTLSLGSSVSDSGLVTSHLIALTGLSTGTTYFYRVSSRDAAGNLAQSGALQFVTGANDVTAPTVSITAPTNGSTVSGSAVTISANASDNVGVAGVQFQLDGTNIGSEDISSPYSISWNSLSASNGSHLLSAVARDASGNTKTASIAITVSNDITPPAISAVSASSIFVTSAAITWTTDELSDSQVSYGLTNALGTSTSLNSSMVTSHSVPLSGLTANTNYFFVVKSRDAAGNLAISSTSTFKTLVAPDTTAPTVSMTAPTNGSTVSGSAVTVSANASDNTGVVGVQFQLDGVNLGAEDTASPYSTSWNTTLSGNGSHTLTAIARDAAGNSNTASVTVTVNNDVTAPTVSMTAPANGATVSGSALTVSASASDNVGVVGVQFKLDGVNLGAEDTSSPYSVAWNTTLTTNASHTLSAVARDAAGNTNTASVTVTVNNDTTPPTINGISVGVGMSSATIVWTTNEASDSQVDFGTSLSLGSTVSDSSMVTSHLITLTGLSSGITYFYRVSSRDASGNLAQSGSQQFVTNNQVVTGNQPPTVSLAITQLPPYALGSVLTLSANAADSDGSIAHVDFYIGPSLIGVKTGAAPYTLSYQPPFAGTYVFSAIAYDNQGAASSSSVLIVSVVSPLPTPVLRLPRSVKANETISATYPDGYNIHHFEWTFTKVSNSPSAAHALAAASGALTVRTPLPQLDLSTTQLDPADYQLSLRAVDNAGAMSPDASAPITLAPIGVDAIKVYPNPWRADKHQGINITFGNISSTAVIKIFTTSGQWVKTLTNTGGTATWDLKNDSGDLAASGLYFYLATDEQSKAKPSKGKFVIIR